MEGILLLFLLFWLVGAKCYGWSSVWVVEWNNSWSVVAAVSQFCSSDLSNEHCFNVARRAVSV